MLHGLIYRYRAAIRPFRCECVKTVDDRKDACSDRNHFSSQAVWISAAIPLFVVGPNNGNNWVRKLDAVENFRADDRMDLHSIEFFGREASGFGEDLLRNGELAYVVEHGRCAQGV